MKRLYAFLIPFFSSTLLTYFLALPSVYFVAAPPKVESALIAPIPAAQTQNKESGYPPAQVLSNSVIRASSYPATSSSSSLFTYIVAEAKKQGINPVFVEWIIKHESSYDPTRKGDDGQSLGLWQISMKYHPEVGDQCALNYQCSTSWALNYLKSGHWNEWSTWRFRCTWYAAENPPNCS